MTVSLNDTESVLAPLAEIRRTLSHTINRFSNDRHCILQFGYKVSKLDDAVCALKSAIPSEPTNQQVVGLRRDVKEFRADLAALRCYVDELCGMTSGVEADMAAVKTALDTIQTRFEESDV